MNSKVKELMDRFKNNKKNWFYAALILIVVIGLIVFLSLFISGKSDYNAAFAEYENHEHTSSCYEKTLDCNSYSYWHTHSSSCYKEELDCEFSYGSAALYADMHSDTESIRVYFIIFVVAVVLLFLCIRFSHLFKKLFKKFNFKKFNESFDETDSKWIEWLKRYIKAWFVIEILGSIAGGIYFSIDCGNPVPLLIAVPAGILVALVNKCINMIILQYLNNINSIRINTEKLVSKTEEKPAEVEDKKAEEKNEENEDE